MREVSQATGRAARDGGGMGFALAGIDQPILVSQGRRTLLREGLTKNTKAGLNQILVRKLSKSGLIEMLVKCKCFRDMPLLHHYKRNAIGKRIGFVLMVFEVLPPLEEQFFVDLNQFN